MGMTTSLVALALLGGEPTPPGADSGHEITCQVQVLTVEGLDWRQRAYPMLKPAARQGTATIWTADRALVPTLEAAAVVRPTGQATAVKAPRVTTVPGAVATITSDKTQDYFRHVQRQSDGPINGGTQLAFVPEVATVREGFAAVFSGRPLDQGVLAQVKFTESHIGSLHTITLSERVTPPPVPPPASLNPAEVGRHIVQTVLAPKAASLNTTVQIPEVFLAEVNGEWFVPSNDVLLISTGVNTVAATDGKAVVQEHLAILDFNRPVAPVDACLAQAACRVDENTAVALENYANLSMPRVPDRSFPEAVDAEGKVHDLPPLPEAYAAMDLNQISPGSPLATPQGTPITRPGRSISDPQLARTSFEPIPDSEIQQWAPQPFTSEPARPIAFTSEPARPIGLAAMVESFLRKGMDAACQADRDDRNPGLYPTLPNNNMTDLGPDRQEPWPIRSCPDIVTTTDETVTGRDVLGSGPIVINGKIGTPTASPAKSDAAICPTAGCPFSAEGCDEPGTLKKVMAPAQVAVDVNFSDPTGFKASSGPLDINGALKNPGKAEVKYVPLGNGLSLQIEAKVVPTPAGVAHVNGAPTQR